MASGGSSESGAGSMETNAEMVTTQAGRDTISASQATQVIQDLPRKVILVDPTTHEPLKLIGEHWVGVRTGHVIPTQLGFPSFFDTHSLKGPAKAVYDMFNRFAPILGLFEKFVGPLFKQLSEVRKKIVSELRLKNGSTVLEVGVGIGGSIQCLPPNVAIYGVDYCPKVLRYCQKALAHAPQKPMLLHAAADGLPFASNSFDSVFHVGAFNYFPDQSKALREMLRVTKVGGRVVVADETRQCATSQTGLERLACKSMAVRGPQEMPTGLLPAGVGDVELSTLWRGKIYILSFTKTW